MAETVWAGAIAVELGSGKPAEVKSSVMAELPYPADDAVRVLVLNSLLSLDRYIRWAQAVDDACSGVIESYPRQLWGRFDES